MKIPKQINMLRVEDPISAIEPLSTDTSIRPKSPTPSEPIGIEPTPADTSGESGSSPVRSAARGVFSRLGRTDHV